MSVKLSVTGEPKASPVAETDLIDSAIEIHAAYESLLESGVQIAELDTVVGNINFIKDTIQTNGVKWFKENCDPKDDFGRLYGLTGSDKETWMKGCDAAVEGLLGDIWNRIKEWWEKFINWIKGLFRKNTEKEISDTITQSENKAKSAADEIKKTPEKKDKVPKTGVSKKGSNLFMRGFNVCRTKYAKLVNIVKGLKNKSSTEAIDTSSSVSVVENPDSGKKDSMPTLEGIILFPEALKTMATAMCKMNMDNANVVKDFLIKLNAAKAVEELKKLKKAQPSTKYI